MANFTKQDLPATFADEWAKLEEIAKLGIRKGTTGGSWTSRDSGITYTYTSDNDLLEQLLAVLEDYNLPSTDVNRLMIIDEDQTITARKTFAVTQRYNNAVIIDNDNDLVPKKYVDQSISASDSVILENETISTLVNAGDCVLFDEVSGEWISEENGIGVYDGTNIILLGVCNLSNLDEGANYYAQTDGSTTVDSSDFKVGYAISDTTLLVNIAGDYGHDGFDPSTLIMENFFAIAGESNTVRLNMENSSNADGYMVRYKTSLWINGDDETTGTLVDNFTTDYTGANVWYEIATLTDNTEYYFKSFPYKGSAYNTTIGENETVVTAGGLQNEYTGIFTGNNIVDNTGNNEGNSTNVTTATGKIGTAISYLSSTASSLFARSLADTFVNDTCIDFWVNANNTSNTITMISLRNGGDLTFNIRNRTTFDLTINGTIRTAGAISFGVWTHIHATRSLTDGMELYIDNILVDTSTYTGAMIDVGWQNAFGALNSALERRFDGLLNQVRIFNRIVTEEERNNLYNGGNGC